MINQLKRNREKGCSIKPLKLDMFEKPKITKKMLKRGSTHDKKCICFPDQNNVKIYFDPKKKKLDDVIQFWQKHFGKDEHFILL
jgi:hypothetical protein